MTCFFSAATIGVGNGPIPPLMVPGQQDPRLRVDHRGRIRRQARDRDGVGVHQCLLSADAGAWKARARGTGRAS
eukprot:2820972-Prorocentrum_lima.AAC.1